MISKPVKNEIETILKEKNDKPINPNDYGPPSNNTPNNRSKCKRLFKYARLKFLKKINLN